MKTKFKLNVLPLAAVLMFAAMPAQAQLAPIMLMDAWAKKENKFAAATPGHSDWCAQNHRGYRPQYNNYNDKDGIMRYCASPFYTPPWQVPYAQRAQ